MKKTSAGFNCKCCSFKVKSKDSIARNKMYDHLLNKHKFGKPQNSPKEKHSEAFKENLKNESSPNSNAKTNQKETFDTLDTLDNHQKSDTIHSDDRKDHKSEQDNLKNQEKPVKAQNSPKKCEICKEMIDGAFLSKHLDNCKFYSKFMEKVADTYHCLLCQHKTDVGLKIQNR